MNFAIIPDIHASIDRLTKSLAIAPSHQLIFLGDLIDGGANPGKCDDLSVLETVKALVDCGRACVVMGNHELNAIMFHRRSDEYNLPFRPHEAGNLQQHKSFIDTFGIETEDALYWTGWMLENFPLWIEYDEFRIVHACWSSRAIDIIKARRPDGFLKFEDLYEIACGETPFAKAVEMLTSGPEVCLPDGYSFRDRYGVERNEVRLAWWNSDSAFWRSAALSVPDVSELPEGKLPSKALGEIYAKEEVPVFVGHYKMTGTPKIGQSNAVSLDYPNTPCVYLFGGEAVLQQSNLVFV